MDLLQDSVGTIPSGVSDSSTAGVVGEGGTVVSAGQASGFGASHERGGGGTGQTSRFGNGYATGEGRAKGRNFSYVASNFDYIRERILKNLTYPAAARRKGWKGTVTISFIIGEDGLVGHIRVVESSGYGILDAHAIRTIKNCQPFPRPPAKAELIIPITYRIG